MLAAQIVVIIVSLELRPISEFEWWLWNLDREWNIPSTLASIQLAMVAGVALATAWLAKFRPAWQRLYLVGIGVVFLFFAQDEYFSIHEARRQLGNLLFPSRRFDVDRDGVCHSAFA